MYTAGQIVVQLHEADSDYTVEPGVGCFAAQSIVAHARLHFQQLGALLLFLGRKRYATHGLGIGGFGSFFQNAVALHSVFHFV